MRLHIRIPQDSAGKLEVRIKPNGGVVLWVDTGGVADAQLELHVREAEQLITELQKAVAFQERHQP